MLIIIFTVHSILWFTYLLLHILLENHKFFKNKLKETFYKGDILTIIQNIIREENIILPLHLEKGEYPHFNMRKNIISYVSRSSVQYSGMELFANVHEIVHARQKQNRYWAYKVREIWSLKFKTSFASVIVTIVFLVFSLNDPIINHMLLFSLSLFIGMHYFICTVILISEINANKITFQWLLKYKLIKTEERHQFKKMKHKESFDYLVSFPILLVIG